MSAGYSITAVVSKLKAREVPAELAYAPVATCFMEYAKDLLGTDGVAMAAHIVAHGMVKGGGLEMEEPCDFRERVEAARAALRYALTLADELREASYDERLQNARLMCGSRALAASLLAAKQHRASAEEQEREAVLALAIGLREYAERDLDAPLTRAPTTPVAWAVVGMGKDGGLRDFACSIRDAVIVQGGKTAAQALMRTMLGTVMLDAVHDCGWADMFEGEAKGLPGAVLHATVLGSWEAAENLCKSWGALFGWPRPRAAELVASRSTQTEVPGSGYDVHELFSHDESQQLFRVILLSEGGEAGLDEENINQISDGLKRLNLFGIIQMFIWRIRKLQYVASEFDMVEDMLEELLSVMPCGKADAHAEARRYVIKQLLRCCGSLTENRRIGNDRRRLRRVNEIRWASSEAASVFAKKLKSGAREEAV